MTNIVDIGPECFADTDLFVIAYKGEYYYRSCDAFVSDRPDGGQSFCVKRVNHPGTIHEAYDGTTRGEVTTYNYAYDLANAIDITVEYIGNDLLPAKKGWSWFDALSRYNPDMARRFVEHPIHFHDEE